MKTAGKNTFSILYYKKENPQKSGSKAPLFARVTVKGQSTSFSLQLKVAPAIWNAKAGRAIGKSAEAKEINEILDGITTRLKNVYNEFVKYGENVNAFLVKQAYLGNSVQYLISYFKVFNEKIEKGIGTRMAQSTFNKYDLTLRRLVEFLTKKHHGMTDILFSQIDNDFITDFNDFLRDDYKMKKNSVAKLVNIFKRIMSKAMKNGIIKKDPFVDFNIETEHTDPTFLTDIELARIMTVKLSSDRLTKVRDIFVFCCFTGLSYGGKHGKIDPVGTV